MSFEWLNEHSEQFLQRGYLRPGQTGKGRVEEIAAHFGSRRGVEKGEKFLKYAAEGYYSFASPVWSNYGDHSNAYSVSCFGSYIEDSVPSILETVAEVGSMSQKGGGCSGYIGNIRPRGSKVNNGRGTTSGSVHFLELFETLTDVISQSGVRRGFFTPYLDVEHGDIEEFIAIGSEGVPVQTLTTGVNFSDEFMQKVKNKDRDALRVWAKFIMQRKEVGYPYGNFISTVNRNTVDVYKDKGMKIYASNMCNEIALPSSSEESFVCVLSAMNVTKWEDWRHTDAVEILTEFLDSVVDDFIEKLERERDNGKDGAKTFEMMKRAYRFAKRHRALGIGSLGLADHLMSKGIPFESVEAADIDVAVHKHIQEHAWEASRSMAKELGEPELLAGYGRRNTTLTACMPTKSSSFILGQLSQTTEPRMSNYYTEDLAKTKYMYKNPDLEKILEVNGYNTRSVWSSIADNDGSVQHLVGTAITQEQADVFKTFGEISPYEIVDRAALRQKYVDQGQSLNLMIGPKYTPKEISELYIHAWEKEVKGLYYSYNTNSSQELTRKTACASCSV